MKIIVLSLLSFQLSAAVLDTTISGATFANPAEISATTFSLEFGVVEYEGVAASFFTRGFGGTIPGPTIRAQAGDTLRITLSNTLEDIDNTYNHNAYSSPNTTNLHTHGLHVSGTGIGDNPFVEIGPGESFEYSIEIPSDHMGGTFWYHPHHHGATSIQAGGGAAGMLIVEDASNEVPLEISAMEEMVMMMLHVDMDSIVSIQEEFNSGLLQVVGSSSTALLVNGLTEPTVTLTSGTWYRWRICFASIETWATMSFVTYTGDTMCEMQLIAKDGVYLNTAPREVTSLPLYSGTRADVAVRCTGIGTATFEGTNSRRRSRRKLQQPGGGGGVSSSYFEGLIQTVNVVSNSGEDAADLTEFTVNRPCYLSDTQSLTPDVSSNLNFEEGLLINGASFVDSSTYIETFAAGNLVELAVTGIGMHPYHQHVNHFQIVAMSPADSTYFQVGDWMDTISDDSDELTLRFFTDKFAGEMVVHCHLLSHEDKGMMGLWEISGSGGEEYDNTLLDPTCYTETSGSRGGDFETDDDGDDDGGGNCLGGSSVVKVLRRNQLIDTRNNMAEFEEEIPLSKLKSGDKVLSLHPTKGFVYAKVHQVLKSKTTQMLYDIGTEDGHSLKSTPHHTFLSCDLMTTTNHRKQTKNKKKMIEARNLELGACLMTSHGKRTSVVSIRGIPPRQSQEDTYTVVMASPVVVGVGGLLSHSKQVNGTRPA